MLAYVAVPIDGPRPELSKDLKAEAISLLHGAQVATYDPTKPFGRGDLEPGAVVGFNDNALVASDGMLAILPDGCPSIGVPMEIYRAFRMDMAVAVVGAQWSVQLRGLGVKTFDPAAGCRAAVDWLVERMQPPTVGSALERAAEGDTVRVSLHVDGERTAEVVARPEGDLATRPFQSEKSVDELVDYGHLRAIQYQGDEVNCPYRAFAGDAGFDLFCSERTQIPYEGFADVPCGISIELPPGVWAMITGRSSTLRKRKLLVSQGIIDNGYRGPLFAGCWNLGEKGQVVEKGERIAQLIPFEQSSANMVLRRVEGLSPSDRGGQGFGSTGE